MKMDDLFEKNDEKTSNNDDKPYTIEHSNSINYTNTKGYYEYITKLMLASSKARVNGDLYTWLECVDALYTATCPWWRDEEKIKEFEDKFDKVNEIINNKDKAVTSNVKGNIQFKIRRLLRDMNVMVMMNTKHIMIRDDYETDNEEDWFDRDDD